MNRLRLRLVGYDEGEISGNSERMRLVCQIEGGGLIAIWGQTKPMNETRNIDAVFSAGLPCMVECDVKVPNKAHSDNFGHKYWVPQDAYLKVISPE
jgi:hypothetical protein